MSANLHSFTAKLASIESELADRNSFLAKKVDETSIQSRSWLIGDNSKHCVRCGHTSAKSDAAPLSVSENDFVERDWLAVNL